MKDHLIQAEFWEGSWARHMEEYLAAPPRCGYWLAARFPDSRLGVLEIAGGSCRDSRYLAERGYDAIGSDFEPRTLDFLARRFPGSPLKLRREDAFALSLPDRSIDLTFHNGFWICFSDDDVLRRLICEQARVTRQHMVAIVHNTENAENRRIFRERAKTDPLYDVRFFHAEEIEALIRSAGIGFRSLRLYKFGGRIDGLLKRRLRGLPNPLAPFAPAMIPFLYEGQSWPETERIACVVDLV
jgi:hypothetical protein